jgi:hypothetical protein
MVAIDLLDDLARRGIEIQPFGADLRVRGPLTNSLRGQIRAHKLSLRNLLELKAACGSDWERISGDPEALAVLTDHVMTARMIRKGQIPPGYTAETICRGCGPVPVWPGSPERVDACPWCFNRISDRPIQGEAEIA